MSSDPTWDNSIQQLFSDPYWIPEPRRQPTGQNWIDKMKGYFVSLDNYDSVKEWAIQIYAHLHSRAMPLSADPSELWPDQALETFRTWANQGYRQTDSDPVNEADRIPLPAERPIKLRIRKDITKLSIQELNEYRSRVDALRAGDPDPNAPWQQIAAIHTNWCLHYQEAFLFWHRANMLWLEDRMGIAIPYWNWMSPYVAEEGNPAAGLPQAFLDETYIDPYTQEERPNPLRYAAARDGSSKACVGHPPEPGCLWVHRDPLLTDPNADPIKRQDKLNQLLTYQHQVQNAFAISTFSTPQGWPGHPWANIPTFPAPDSDYPYLNETFDGTYEQPHDNFHGWVGPDMADNTYTAYDPVFWSHHSMIDLVMELWIRQHPPAQYTANFPLRPFIGPDAKQYNETESRTYLYTSIGDMARDSRSLGYDFADLPAIEAALQAPPTAGPRLDALFEGVRCTMDSYSLELYLNPAEGEPLVPASSNPNFALKMTRLGMGSPDQNGRCIKVGVQRLVDLTLTANRLRLAPEDPIQLVTKVTELSTGRVLTDEERDQLPGFTPRLLWRRVPDGANPPNLAAKPKPPSENSPGAAPSCCSQKN